MKNIWLITLYTLREAFSRKVFIAFFVVVVLALVGFGIFGSLVKVDTLLKGLEGADKQAALNQIVYRIELMLISPVYGLGLLLAIFASSSFIPVMLEKGNIDLLLSKPISRTQLLLGKYFGGILVVFINISILIVGIWLIIFLKFSIISFPFLFAIFTITFSFAVLYALIVLSGVISGNSMLGMMLSYMIYLIISPLLASRSIIFQFIQSDFWQKIITFFYYILPKTSEIDKLTSGLVMNQTITNFQPVYSSFLFLVVVLSLSIYIFEKKDF
jgi:ABC-2 type transport system permease protein